MSLGQNPEVILLERSLESPLPAGRMSVSPLRDEHIRSVHGVLRRAYAGGAGRVPASWFDWWESVRTDSEFDRELALVAVGDGQVAGFCLCWTSSFVKDLAVDPAMQGRGIGVALLAEATARLRLRGHRSIRLKVVAGNEGARRFYARLGFVPV